MLVPSGSPSKRISPCLGLLETHDRASERRLAAARLAREREHLSAPKGQVDAVHGARDGGLLARHARSETDAALEGDVEAADLQDRVVVSMRASGPRRPRSCRHARLVAHEQAGSPALLPGLVQVGDDGRAFVERAPGSAGGTSTRRGSSPAAGGSPPSPDGALRKRGSPIAGKAAASAVVYGCAGLPNTAADGPSSTILPAYMIASRSHTSTSTERSWVMNSIARPISCWSSFSSLRTWAWTITSSAVVGSSAMIRLGLQASAIAIITRCFCPPDSSCG